MPIEISVIIPTFNRSDILVKTLDSLNNQTLPHEEFEVIVVNDGSKDDTEEKFSEFKSTHEKMNLHYLKQRNSGKGIARNLAISEAKGRIIMFIGDDIILDPNCLYLHLKFHSKYKFANNAVLGRIEWHPDLPISDFMNWLTNGSSIFGKFGGHQFAFEKLEGKEEADFNFFYTSNISIKREMIEKKEDQFDEDFGAYGWEDVELAYRLHKKYGLRVFYNKDALGYHYHYMDEKSLQKRMQAIGISSHIIHRKHPELKKVPSLFKKIILLILGSLPSLMIIYLLKSFSRKYKALWYYALSKRYFMQGVLKKV